MTVEPVKAALDTGIDDDQVGSVAGMRPHRLPAVHAVDATVAHQNRRLQRDLTELGSAIVYEHGQYVACEKHALALGSVLDFQLVHRGPRHVTSATENLCVISLLGELVDLFELSAQLTDLKPGDYDLIVLAAWYRLQPEGADENSNSNVAQLYNVLDSVAGKIGSAFACVHHTSKGNQSGKSVMDVGSGTEAQSRAPDTLSMRAHEADRAVVVEAVGIFRHRPKNAKAPRKRLSGRGLS